MEEANITKLNEIGNHRTEFPIFFQVVIHILYNVVFIGAVSGNVLVLYVIASVTKIRTVTNLLLANLAVGDLLISLICLPFTYISILFNYWPFGKTLCFVVSPANAIGVLVSAFTLIALAIERYVSIVHPLTPKLRKRHVPYVIAIVWISAISIASPIAINTGIHYSYNVTDVTNNTFTVQLPICYESGWSSEDKKLAYDLTLTILQYFFPLTVLTFTYTRIALIVWGIQKSSRPANSISMNSSFPPMQHTRSTRKAIVLTLAVVIGYTLAWLPLNLNMMIHHHNPEVENEWYFKYMYFISHWLAMSHATYNPIIYAWLNSTFRRSFKNILVGCRSCETTLLSPQSSGRRLRSSYARSKLITSRKSNRSLSQPTLHFNGSNVLLKVSPSRNLTASSSSESQRHQGVEIVNPCDQCSLSMFEL